MCPLSTAKYTKKVLLFGTLSPIRIIFTITYSFSLAIPHFLYRFIMFGAYGLEMQHLSMEQWVARISGPIRSYLSVWFIGVTRSKISKLAYGVIGSVVACGRMMNDQ